MKKVAKAILIALGIILVIMAVAVLGVNLYVQSAATHARIAHAIDTALKALEPRIAVDTIDVSADPQASETAIATIAYRLVATGAAQTVALDVPLAAAS